MENLGNDSGAEELFGIAIDPAVLFANHKNVYKRRIEKRQRKFVEKLTYLKPFLRPDDLCNDGTFANVFARTILNGVDCLFSKTMSACVY